MITSPRKSRSHLCLRQFSPALAAVLIAAAIVPLWSASSAAANPDCDGEPIAAHPEAFHGLPESLSVRPICPVDVGPGLGSETSAEFSALSTGEVTNTSFDPDLDVLGVLVGTVRTGSGESYVDALLSELGPRSRGGTVQFAGRVVQYINLLPEGPRGFAYGEGRTVVIGYIRPPLGSETDDIPSQAARGAFTRILASATGAPLPNLPVVSDWLEQWPVARGNYTSPTDPGWTFFHTSEAVPGLPVYSCGIAPNGIMAGCDYVPEGAPPGTNQTIVDSSGARYVHSPTPTFTRNVDTLRAGERVENGPAACGVSYQGPVTCRVGEHRFITNVLLE